MYCKRCGKESMNGGDFCLYCGAAYEQGYNMPQQNQPTQQNVQQNFGQQYSQQNQYQPYGTAYPQPEQPAYQPYPTPPMPYVTPKKSSNGFSKVVIVAVIVIALLGLFIVLEAAGVTNVTGWFDNDDNSAPVVNQADDDKEDQSGETTSDSEDGEDDEFDETISNPDTKEHEYDKYSETRTSDGDGDSEFSYNENSYQSDPSQNDSSQDGENYNSGSASDEEKVREYVELNKSSYEASSSNDVGKGFLEARGTSVVCGFQYSVDLPSGTAEAFGDTMESEAMVTMFENVTNMVKAEEPAVTSVFIEYYDKNGKLLYSKEFR